MKRQLILLGAPGCGKGTQASNLVKDFGFTHLSTGDLLRQELAKKSELGNKISDIMNSGALVDDLIVLELLKANCDLDNATYIFDGFPRNLEQTELLDAHVLKDAPSVAVYFDVDLSKVMERIVNRRSCSKCGSIYNLIYNAPLKEGTCDKCGGDLLQRKDDNEEVVRNRLDVYQTAITPVLKYYEEKGVLRRVDGSLMPDQVSAAIAKILGN